MASHLSKAAFALSLTFCTPAAADPGPLENVIRDIVGNVPEISGAMVALRPAGQADWQFATGRRAVNGSSLRPDDEFRIASVTKTYVAAAVLRLAEQGKLNVEDPIAKHLDPQTADQLRKRRYNPDKITIKHLLSHRAGLRDYSTVDAYFGAIADDPGRTWTRSEQVAITMATGKPLFRPGTKYAYSDAGYVLAGEIIERATGQALNAAIPALLRFDQLGISRTYWEQVPTGMVNPVPANRAHAYQDGIDTASFNPSFDIHGGGGLVATTQDVLVFFEALTEGRVFSEPATLALMTEMANDPLPKDQGLGYGLGIERFQVGPSECWGHKGHWSVIAMWCPTLDAGYVVTLNAAGEAAYQRIPKIVQVLNDHIAAEQP